VDGARSRPGRGPGGVPHLLWMPQSLESMQRLPPFDREGVD
jgi:hypothetical protein